MWCLYDLTPIGAKRMCIPWTMRKDATAFISIFPFVIKLEIGLNVFPRDSSPFGRISLPISLLRQAIDHSDSGKLHDKSVEDSWELIKNLALYDHKSWNDSRDLAKLVKAISLPQNVPSTFDQPEGALEDKFKDLHLKLSVLEALALAPMHNAILDKYVESLELKNRKHFKTLSLDESRLPNFDLFSDQEEYSKEEVAETVAETMEQYMNKTRTDYGSGVARPKIEDKDNFELKGQFLKELRGGYRATTMGFYQRNDANLFYQEQKQSMKETLSKFMGKSAKRHEEKSNLIKEIRTSTDAAIRNQGALIRTLEIQIGQMSKNVCFDNALGDLEASISLMPLLTYLNLGIGKFVFSVDFIILDMPEDIKVPLIPGRPFLSTAHAKIDVFKRNITLRVGEKKIIFKSIKPGSSLIKRVYMLTLRERIELDLEARLMGKTLVLNRSLDPFFGDYIELKNLNVQLKPKRDEVDDLMATIKEGEVVEEFRARNDVRMVSKNFRYPSNCDHDKKIRIDCAHNLKFSYMIDFAVLEDMDAYRDEAKGDVIFDTLFLREFRINARRSEGMITIYNGNEEVTYQIVRSHPRFKHHTNEQCNKISPLLKMSEEDMMNEISHSYLKLKSFYKGILNLGPEVCMR
nr:hypothetical protein [Tanacetum cinerariifolium]